MSLVLGVPKNTADQSSVLYSVGEAVWIVITEATQHTHTHTYTHTHTHKLLHGG